MSKRNLLLATFFVFLTVIITFPAVFYLSQKMIGDNGDGYQFIGFQYIAKRLFFEGKFPFGWTNFWRYPYGIEFQNTYDSSLFIILGLILYQFFQNPILIYNLSVFFLIFLNLGLSYFSFRLFFDRMLSVIGAVIYGLSFYSLARLGGHINLFLTSSIIFFFFSLVKILKEEGSIKSFVFFSVSLILVAFSSLQYPLFILGALPFLLILLFVFYKSQVATFMRIIYCKKKYLLISIASALAFFSIFHGQKLVAWLNNEVQMPVFHITSVPIINFFLPNCYLKSVSSFITNASECSIESVVFLGYVEILIFVAAIIFLKKSRAKSFFISTFIIFFIISLGHQTFFPKIWPYQYLFSYFPYRAIIEPGRFFIIFYLAFTLLILLFLKKVTSRKLLIILLAFLILERLPWQFNLNPNMYEEKFINKLKTSASRAVLNLPLYVDWWNGQFYDIYSVYSEKPMVNGYIQWSGNTPESQKLTKLLEEYTCYYDPQYAPSDFNVQMAKEKKNLLIQILKDYDIRTVVVHKDLHLNDEHCIKARGYIETLIEDKNRWENVFEDKAKMILWLKY